MAPDIALQGVRKSFGATPILDGVDLEVRPGELLVLMGPSGCGKTTLLRVIAGLESVDEGEIRLAGKVANDLRPKERDVAMVFQSYALYPHMSVRENLAFGLLLAKAPEEEIVKRVAEAAALLELTPLLERSPAALSGGQRQRVAIGRAIVRRPRAFLFDEPLSNLDTALRVQMRGEIARLHQRLRATMVYVTHDQVEAMTLATRLAAFDRGRLQQVGAPLDLYRKPVNRFVAGLLGSPAMNFLAARAEPGRLVGAGFELPLPGDARELRGPCLIGIRPQELKVAASGPLKGQVEAVERLGFEGYAFLKTEAGHVAARFKDATPVALGQTVSAAPAGDAFHIFTASGDGALRHPPCEKSPVPAL